MSSLIRKNCLLSKIVGTREEEFFTLVGLADKKVIGFWVVIDSIGQSFTLDKTHGPDSSIGQGLN